MRQQKNNLRLLSITFVLVMLSFYNRQELIPIISLLRASCLTYPSTLKMEIIVYSETSG
jgi:hypothetical protein